MIKYIDFVEAEPEIKQLARDCMNAWKDWLNDNEHDFPTSEFLNSIDNLLGAILGDEFQV